MASDTSNAAMEIQMEIYRKMAPAERVQLAVEMSEEARRITQAGMRARHPHLDASDLHKRFLRTLLGESLYAKTGIDERE